MKKKRGLTISKGKKRVEVIKKPSGRVLKKKKIVKKQIKKQWEYISIVPYIKNAISKGYSKGQIKVALLAKNWPEVYIEKAFTEVNSPVGKKKRVQASLRSKYNSSVTSSLSPEVTEFGRRIESLKGEVKKVVIGQEKVVNDLLICLICGGNALLEGVPGIAKTLIMITLAKTIGCSSKRIQFTADLLPTDITGFVAYSQQKGFFVVKGPVFANIVLADEINRTPPKTQAALLQAMQEHEVTAAGETYKLDEPFFVLATQNPIEQEGTYPLPEAQLDRFMFNVFVDYPSSSEEQQIVKSTTAVLSYDLDKILSPDDIIGFQNLVRRVPVSDHLIEYAVELVRTTRPGETNAPDFVKNWVNWGAGPRASQYLILAAKTKAILEGRPTPGPEDVRFAAYPVLRHRIVTSFNAEADGVDTSEIIKRILDKVKAS